MKFLKRLIKKIINKFKAKYFSLTGIIYKSKFLEKSESYPRGYTYIVFGEAFLRECILSAKSLKRFTRYPIHLFTDQKDFHHSDMKIFDSISYVPFNHIRGKVDYIALSPFDQTIYLDSDTIIVYDIDELFELLDIYPVLATLDIARKRQFICEKISAYKMIPYSFGELNGGVLCFNKYAKEKILSRWPKIYYKYYSQTNGWDQPSLRILLWKYKVPVFILPPEFNIRSKDIFEKIRKKKQLLGKEHMKPRIFHMHINKEIHKNIYKEISLEELEGRANTNAYEINY